MAAASEIVLLKSTLQIQNKWYSVKLTPTEIYWESLNINRAPGGPYSQPLVTPPCSDNSLNTGLAAVDSDQHYYSTLVSGHSDTSCQQQQPLDGKQLAELQQQQKEQQQHFPVGRHNPCSTFICCTLWSNTSDDICSVCQKPKKAENQQVKLADVVAVRLGGSGGADDRVVAGTRSAHGTIELTQVGTTTSFSVYHARPIGRHRWRQFCISFHTNDASVVSQWVDKISEILAWPEFNRPQSLLVFVNPIAGRRRSTKIYREKVAPLFELARIKTEVIQTERRHHARDLLLQMDLSAFDGVISVGGDGMFAEIAHGLLTRTLKSAGLDQPAVDTPLTQPKWRVGIIPAGSTDTVCYSIQGINDSITAALHIILGDNIAVDVGTLFHGPHFIKYNISFLGYGYYGDCILDSEHNRWMGPKRYDWEGFKKVLSNRSYEGEISFLPSPNKESHPRDGTFCKVGCSTCQSCRPQHRLCNETGDDTPEVQWQTVRGRFSAINSFLVSCRCRYALEGPAPAAHLGDGCTDLVVLRNCSRFDFTRHLYRCSDPESDQFDFPFVQTFRVTRFRFRPINALDDLAVAVDDLVESSSEVKINSGQHLHEPVAPASIWNCDGEVVDEPTIDFRVHPQAIRLFARGIDDEGLDASQTCLCCSKSVSSA